MKSIPVIIALCGTLLVQTAFAAAPFEGKITLTLTTGQDSQHTLDLAMKGQKQRIDMAVSKGQKIGSIIDLAQREVTVLMPQQQMFMVMPIKEAVEAAQRQIPEGKLEKTGRTGQVLGYLCQILTLKADGKITEIWLAEGLGSFAGLGGGGGPMGGNTPSQSVWEQALAGVAGFPLRVVEKDAQGNETFRLEATKVDKTPQPDSLFALPAGYQKFDLGGMMQGLPGGMPFGRP
ncbi:MAG: DUF4412 domain-containing protein [Opitutaceae bacterium]|nr:DUF4412 domain-containing protein [Opitutaceae bacterium]